MTPLADMVDDEPEEKSEPKSGLAHLVDDDEKDEPDEEEAEPVAAKGYDLDACANDIMSAVQAGDVPALKEALEDLLAKGSKK